MLWDSHLKKPALVADVVVRPREHPARGRPQRPGRSGVAVGSAVGLGAAVVAEGADEGGVDGHVSEELANLDGQRLLLGEETS